MKIVYLYPKSTFRTEFHSDTLWGILCWAIRMVYGNDELERILNSYIEKKPEFIISSTFPFVKKNDEKFHYLPKPITKEIYEDQSQLSRKERIQNALKRKKLKKVQLLELNDYTTFIKDPSKSKEIIEKIAEEKNLFSLQSESIPHNTINRLTGGTLKLENKSGQLFYVDEYYLNTFDENVKAGLFFLVKGNTDKLEGALRFLNHIGYGGDRNTGKGHFIYELDDFSISEPNDFNAYTNLSLYYPTKEELEEFKNSNLFSYQLVERQGFVGFNTYKETYKPVTLMFAEGSVFPKIDVEYWGQNKIVMEKSERLPHNIYQYGFGFMIKIKI